MLAEYLDEVKSINLIRMPKIIQAIMFMLNIDRSTICEPASNLLSWKLAKPHLDQMVDRMI
jgi:hypothetical protein